MKQQAPRRRKPGCCPAIRTGRRLSANGELAGHTLPEALDQWGDAAVGDKAAAFPYFPILIKLIDARDRLSVQVHPDDAYAMRVEGEFGKTEMWYVVDCEPGAALLYGFSRGLTQEEFRRRIETDTLEEVCNRVPVKKGDVFFIEAGTLHAIGAGILHRRGAAELQHHLPGLRLRPPGRGRQAPSPACG